MKSLKVFMGAAFLFVFLMGGLAVSNPTFAGTDTATLGVTMQVNGMTCIDCAQKVEAGLLKVPGVKAAEVSLDKNEAKVEFENEKVTTEQLIAAVKGAGFDAHLKK